MTTTERPLRVGWLVIVGIGLAIGTGLDALLFLIPGEFTYLLLSRGPLYGWALLMLVAAARASPWLSPWLLLLGAIPLVLAPGILAEGIDPIPWLVALFYLAAAVVALAEGPFAALDRWHERRSH